MGANARWGRMRAAVAVSAVVTVMCAGTTIVGAEKTTAAECECLDARDPRFLCAPHAHENGLSAETARRVMEAAIAVGKRDGWERARFEHQEFHETRMVRVSALPKSVQDEVDRAFETRVAPMIREQCVIYDHLKFENEQFYVVKYDAKEFKSIDMHHDDHHLSFVASLNNVTDYSGGGNNFEGVSFSVKAGGVEHLNDHKFDPQPTGSIVIHGGKLNHASLDVTRGTRYVLVGEVHVNKSCCFDFTTYMNKFVTKLLVFLFFIVAVMTGVVDKAYKQVQKVRNGGVSHEKVW